MHTARISRIGVNAASCGELGKLMFQAILLSMKSEELYRGDIVEVKSPSEILSTLDELGALAGLPFMPEMAAYCGRRFRVDRRADKVCDTVKYTGSRRVPNAVLLEDLRCNGSGHRGCQAECRIFWKDAWLRKVAPDAPPIPPSEAEALIERASRNIQSRTEKDGKFETRYRCQNTDILHYSKSGTLAPMYGSTHPATSPYLTSFKSPRAPWSPSPCPSLDTSRRSTFLAPPAQAINSSR